MAILVFRRMRMGFFVFCTISLTQTLARYSSVDFREIRPACDADDGNRGSLMHASHCTAQEGGPRSGESALKISLSAISAIADAEGKAYAVILYLLVKPTR